MAKTNAVFMSGVPELLILRLLAKQEMYGYELVKAIQLSSQHAFSLAEGVVYPNLHSLESKGFLKARERQVDGRNRVYYQTTAKGLKRLRELQGEWNRVSEGIESVLRRNLCLA